MINFIVIPCWNEEKNIRSVIEKVKPYGRIVVVDDCSTDNSYEIAKQQDVAVLRHMINCGQGAALQTGHDYALEHGAETVVDFDSDGQMVAEEIPNMLEPILAGSADISLGSRFLDDKSKIPFLKKWFILKPASIFQNTLFGIKLTDAHNGFRALSRRALEKIRITQDRYAHNTEIIEQIKINDLRYKEIPVTIIYKEFGQSWLGGLKILSDLFLRKISK